MEVEGDNPNAPLSTRDRLMLETIQHVFRQLEGRSHWAAFKGVTKDGFNREALLKDWMTMVNEVRDEVESVTIFNDEISRSEWPDVPVCLVLGTQAFLAGELPTTPPSSVEIETWKIFCSFLTIDLIEQRQQLMDGYLKDFIKRQNANYRIGPAFDPVLIRSAAH